MYAEGRTTRGEVDTCTIQHLNEILRISEPNGRSMNLRSLPPRVQDLFDQLNVPARQRWHSILVHDVASEVVDRLRRSFQNLSLDEESNTAGGGAS